jgi:hypothetical protein
MTHPFDHCTCTLLILAIDGHHLIITYCALLALAAFLTALKDGHTSLDRPRPALASLLGASQVADGGYVHRASARK